jgi:hypothetical protein
MHRKTLISIIIIGALLFATSYGGKASQAYPDRIIQIAHLPGGEYSSAFGCSVAIAGGTVAVGDPYDSQYAEEAGAVTIFQPNQNGQWTEITRIGPVAPRQGDHFGRNLALSGDRLVVGAPYDINFGVQPGSAYIFERNEGGSNAWGQVAKLTASDAHPNDNYGWAVTIDGNTVVIGAYTQAMGGSVYVYMSSASGSGQWEETMKLSPDPPGYQAGFGESLDLDGDLLAVGAYAGGDYAGYVYVFQHTPDTDQWQRLTRFRAADTAPYHYFGYSVALDNWTILAGAPGAYGLTGAAYIFTADPNQPELWTNQARLAASDGALGDYFALELDLYGRIAWIGAPVHDSYVGAVYVYGRDQGGTGQWGETTSIVGDDTLAGDEFGYWTSIDGNLAVAGAPGSPPVGSAYIFDLNQPWRIHLPIITH